MMSRFMFDSNCFYQISFNHANMLNTDGNEYFVTPIQYEELQRKEISKDFSEERKQRLLKVFEMIEKNEMPLETGLLGHREAGKFPMKLGTKGFFDQFKKALDEIKKQDNNIEDTLIAEVAISNEVVFVTSEKKLIEGVKRHFPYFVMSFEEFKQKFLTKNNGFKDSEVGRIPEGWKNEKY